VAALARADFEVTRVRGSHHFMKHSDGRATCVPVHAGETIGPGLISRILRDCELTRDEFLELLDD
jgi:predicted RNA binding protein YcfA (HicA-like mRNA interferase family)